MSTNLPLTRYWQTVQDFRSEIKQLSHDPDLGTACLQHLTDLEILLHPHAAAVPPTGVSIVELEHLLATIEARCWELWHAASREENWSGSLERLDNALRPLQIVLDRTTTAGTAVRQKKRRRAKTTKVIPLTAKEAEAVQMVSEHKGNVAAAAQACGKSRAAMKKLYDKGMKKLGKTALPKPRTQPLPHDRRGQVDL